MSIFLHKTILHIIKFNYEILNVVIVCFAGTENSIDTSVGILKTMTCYKSILLTDSFAHDGSLLAMFSSAYFQNKKHEYYLERLIMNHVGIVIRIDIGIYFGGLPCNSTEEKFLLEKPYI